GSGPGTQGRPDRVVADRRPSLGHALRYRPAHSIARAGRGAGAGSARLLSKRISTAGPGRFRHRPSGRNDRRGASQQDRSPQKDMMTDAMTSRLRPVQPGKTTLVAVLDIGSTKICCIIARLTPRAE